MKMESKDELREREENGLLSETEKDFMKDFPEVRLITNGNAN